MNYSIDVWTYTQHHLTLNCMGRTQLPGMWLVTHVLFSIFTVLTVASLERPAIQARRYRSGPNTDLENDVWLSFTIHPARCATNCISTRCAVSLQSSRPPYQRRTFGENLSLAALVSVIGVQIGPVTWSSVLMPTMGSPCHTVSLMSVSQLWILNLDRSPWSPTMET